MGTVLQYQYYQIALSAHERHFSNHVFYPLRKDSCKTQWLPNQSDGKKNAINSRRKNPALRNGLFDLTTEGLSMNFQNYAKGNLDYSPCKIASELQLN